MHRQAFGFHRGRCADEAAYFSYEELNSPGEIGDGKSLAFLKSQISDSPPLSLTTQLKLYSKMINIPEIEQQGDRRNNPHDPDQPSKVIPQRPIRRIERSTRSYTRPVKTEIQDS